MSPTDTPEDALQKARNVRLVVLDVDGVMTDGAVVLGAEPLQAAAFHVHDGTGVKYLHRAGIRTAIISGRRTEAVAHRARMLGIEEVVQGAKVKLEAYEAILERSGLEDAAVAYIGDDLPDIPVMRRAGLAVAVADAVPEVLREADLVTRKPGGRGAVRELAEFVLKAQNKWEMILERYLA